MVNVIPSSPLLSLTLDLIIPSTPTPERSDVNCALDLTANKKGGHRPKFTAEDDLILAREVSAAKAHVAGYGKIQKRVGEAATRENLNRKLSKKVTAKSVQDRYKKIQDPIERRHAADRRL